MNDKILTIAIHTPGKAQIMMQVLESKGIEVFTEEISNPDTSDTSSRIAIKVKETDLLRAFTAIGATNLFNYSNKETYKIDDGKKRILVAVDFSDYSIKACRAAFKIASEIDAKIKILHVYNKLFFPSNIPFADALKEEGEISIMDRSRKKMLDLCLEIDRQISEGKMPSVNYSYSLREGYVVEEIDDFIQEYKPVLLVVGTKGKHNNQKYMLGNVTADIIEITDVPVIAVPENTPFKDLNQIKHIAFLTNFQERDLVSFDMLVKILKPYNDVKITLLHINRIDKKGGKHTEDELASMREFFMDKYPLLNVGYKFIDSPDLLESILEFIEGDNVNIVALNTRKRNLFGRMFIPSISRKVLSKSNVGLLILRG